MGIGLAQDVLDGLVDYGREIGLAVFFLALEAVTEGSRLASNQLEREV